MDSMSLHELAEELLGTARTAPSGRAAHTIFGGTGHSLRQTLIALLSARELAEHNSPGQATLQMLRGHVRISTTSDAIDGEAGTLITIPPERHALLALDDAAVLLTVVAQ